MSSSFLQSRQTHAYGHGRMGVLQEYLLTQMDVERLVAARDTAELARLLTELKLSSHVEYNSNPHRFINNLEHWLKQEVESMVKDSEKEIFNILWLKDDAALLSYLLKKQHGFTSDISAEPHVGATAYDPADLRLLVKGGDVSTAPASLTEFIDTMREDAALTPQQIDTRVAQFNAHEQLALAKKSSEAIRLYVAHHIDLQNIRTARRLRNDENPAEHLISGGEIDIARFSLDPAKLADLVRASHLGAELADNIQTAADSTIILERGLAKAIAVDIARMRSKILTLDPIFAFAAIAQSQMKLLRTILVGKSAHLSKDELQRLLPPFLSASPFVA
ncbi:V-type ATPase subunit [Candidatus Peribacteria bacterium]|nr:MAG: V-type ATPase subunit [Candidatus Peribacteria bacterium]